MRDRQVEVVPGTHVVARIAGAVLLVGHRTVEGLNPGSPAVRTLESLMELVRAAEQRVEYVGTVIADDLGRWLSERAEQDDLQHGPDIGILAATGPGVSTLCLHGAVTGLISGIPERYHSRGELCTIEVRLTESNKVVALFVDEAGAAPELPSSAGIGWLMEGIAPGGGVVVWSHGLQRDPAEETIRSAQTDQIDHIDLTERIAATQPDGEQTALVDLDLHNASTERGATDPPVYQASTRHRTEKTAKGSELTVKVFGFTCVRAHPSDPRSAFCTVCGIPVDQTQPRTEVVRPPLGMLVFDDGSAHTLSVDTVLGRDPERGEPGGRGLAPLTLHDPYGGVSRAHAELVLVDWDVLLIDRGSTNGTRTRASAEHSWVDLPPNQPTRLLPGSEILIGDRVLRYEPLAPPPFA